MKKIIAAAVATAFVAPAFAADITISGSMEQAYVDAKTTTSTTKSFKEDTALVFTASGEAGNGISVSTDINLAGDGSNDGGNSITLAGPFGKVDLGDASGAIDSIDDQTDVFKTYDNGIDAGSNDAAVQWTLPLGVDGLTVVYAFSAKDGNDGQNSGNVSSDLSGISAKYAFGNATVAYGSEDVGTDEYTFAGVTYSVAGIKAAYETVEKKVAAGTKTDYNNFAVTYKTGDVTLAVGTEEVSSAGSTSKDSVAYGVHYAVGGGLTVFAESQTDDKTSGKPEQTAIGVVFAF
jgi:hypothetical protein